MRSFSRSSILSLAAGMTFGFCLAYAFLTIAFPSARLLKRLHHPDDPSAYYHGYDSSRGENDVELSDRVGDPFGFHVNHEDSHTDEDDNANVLKEKVRVLCWIMTGPQNHAKKALHVKRTWGKRCNVLVFMSSKEDPSLPAVALPVGEGRENLWGKTRAAYRYVWEKYQDKADWFMKADDDTYVVLENLRYMLSAYNSSEPIAFGHKFKPFVKQGYFSGGAGYVLSRAATKLFVEQGLDDDSKCRQDPGGAEDIEMGKCMRNLNIKAGDSRDSYGRGRFFPFNPEYHLIPGIISKDDWYWHYTYYPVREGIGCCSDTAVSFHYISPNEMYVMEYLIYHLKPFGIANTLSGTAAPPPSTSVQLARPVKLSSDDERKTDSHELEKHIKEKKPVYEMAEKDEE